MCPSALGGQSQSNPAFQQTVLLFVCCTLDLFIVSTHCWPFLQLCILTIGHLLQLIFQNVLLSIYSKMSIFIKGAIPIGLNGKILDQVASCPKGSSDAFFWF